MANRQKEFESLLQARLRNLPPEQQQDPGAIESVRQSVIMEIGPQFEADQAQGQRIKQRSRDFDQQQSDTFNSMDAELEATQSARNSKLRKYAEISGQEFSPAKAGVPPAGLASMGDLRIAERREPQSTSDMVRAAISKSRPQAPQAPQAPIVPPRPAELDESSDLRDAQKLASDSRYRANLGEAFDQIGNSIAGTKADPTFYRGMAAKADQPVKDLIANQVFSKQGRVNKREADLMDANSAQSKTMQSTISRLYPGKFSEGELASISAADSELIFKPLQLSEAIQARREAIQARREASIASTAQAAEGRSTKRSEKQSLFDDGQAERFSKSMEKSGIPDALSTLEDLETELGSSIEDATSMPGYGRVAGLVPDALVGEKAGKIRQLVQKLANVTLKQRSGAAVTNQEYARFKKEYGTGTFVSDDRLIDALKSYKKAIGSIMQNYEAGINPEAKQRYQERGGVDSSSIRQKKQGHQPGDIINVKGKAYRVGADGDELEEIE